MLYGKEIFFRSKLAITEGVGGKTFFIRFYNKKKGFSSVSFIIIFMMPSHYYLGTIIGRTLNNTKLLYSNKLQLNGVFGWGNLRG